MLSVVQNIFFSSLPISNGLEGMRESDSQKYKFAARV